MLSLRLTVLVMLGATCSVSALTVNPDTPECALLFDAMKEHVQDQLAPLKSTIEDVQRTVKTLATLKSIGDLHTSISSLMTTTVNVVENQLENLPKKGDIKTLLKGRTVGGEPGTCDTDEKLDELVETVREVQGRVEETKEAAQETKSKVDQCVQQDVIGEVQGLGGKVDAVDLKIDGLKDDLEAQIRFIRGGMVELTNTTEFIAEAVKEELEEEEDKRRRAELVPTYPCLDSTFSDSINATCQLALRFNRCTLPKVSYHCCRTCTDAGLLPETGPWLHKNLSRRVTTLETLRFFAP